MTNSNLPIGDGRLYLTDSGLETTLIFHDGWDLPEFASCELLKTEKGRGRLATYYGQHAAIAAEGGFGFVMEAPTWRSNPDWGTKLGYDADALDAVNRLAIELMHQWRADIRKNADIPIIISGCVGPRGDGYVVEDLMTSDAAKVYHQPQVDAFAAAGADVVSGMTMTNIAEATGLAQAARAAGIPVILSFTVETDGRLPSGDTLQHAIQSVDADTAAYPSYYMINCAHPTHFENVLEPGAPWVSRIKGVRANASRCSHAELEAATTLDDGDPQELGAHYAELLAAFPQLTVLGGCCGTDHRHIASISQACASLSRVA